jgi:6-pyruvoyltetrahydropterin/6-carboxytetrahydropterin synthase
MYEISIQDHFSAAHHLEAYQGSCEQHHGHNWQVEVYVRGEKLDDTGLLIDFKILKKKVAEILDELDHIDLNNLEVFKEINPTSENIAAYIYRQLVEKLAGLDCSVSKVSVHETPGSIATYSEGG